MKSMPISVAQERLWILEQLVPGKPVYSLSKAFRLTGRLEESTLRQSFTEITRRHEILRTIFPAAGGQPSPVISAPASFDLRVVNFCDRPVPQREQKVRSLAIEQARRPFNLTSDAMLRATLARLAETEYVLLLTVHQLAADAESIDQLLDELTLLYDSFVTGKPSPLPPVPTQYADLAARERHWIESAAAKTQLAFWKQRLNGIPSLLEFPLDRSRPTTPSYRGGRHRVRFDKSLADRLTKVANQEKCSLSILMLAAFQTLASRYTGRRDIVLGAPISNRPQVAKGVVGNFANILPLRTDLADDPAVGEIVRRAKAALLEAQAHAEFPFAKLVEELNPPRDQSYHPLVQACFNCHPEQSPIRPARSLVISPVEIDYHLTPYDLSLGLSETARGLEGWIEYATDLFDPGTIARMAGHLETLLRALLNNPDQRVSRLPLLTERERHELLVECNNTQADFPQHKCLHQLFEGQTEQFPEAVALVFEKERLTYGELNRRANRLAHHLQQLGVGPDVLVGICLTRSVEMIVGMLAVLKAGGAYVPLDPGYPAERLAFILQDAKAPVLLTEKPLSGHLPNYQAKTVFLDDPALWSGIPDASEGEAPRSEVKPENLAYVIYTSGSTGRPKGVAIEHRSPVNFVHWAQQVFSREQLAGVLAATSICFDLSIFEIFVPLSSGGTVILAENALQLTTLPAAGEVTLVNTVPSAIAELVRGKAIPPSVRTVNLAGEPLETALVKQIYQQATVDKVYDLYGPSETTVYSTCALRSSDGPATIGRPISNTLIYLLDEQLQPVPVGVPGELHIGGEGLARGYLNQPSLTAEKFIADPFDERRAGRLYKTGDLARYRTDGNIEFLGRKDNQVKIRGFRIELGEIEMVLRQQDSVEAAVVVARADAQGDKRLVAYYQSDESDKSELSDNLRAFLKSKLPEYMVPAVLVRLPVLPLTPNGKIDRQALPAPEQVRPAVPRTFVGPRTSTEEMLAEIWCEVLGLAKVGIHDNFFEIGGHSLRAIQVISRVRDIVQVELSMRHFFEMPTIAALGGVIEATLIEEISALSEEEVQSLADDARLPAAELRKTG